MANPYTQQPMPAQQAPPGNYPPPPQGYPPQQYPPQQYPPQQGAPYPPQGGAYPPQQPAYANQPPPQLHQPAGPQMAVVPAVATAPPQQAMGNDVSVLDMFTSVEKLVIKQKVDLLEVAGDTASGLCCCLECCLERPNTYNIFDANTGQKLLKVKEESEFCNRCLCNPMHELKLHITDPRTEKEVMIVDRPFRCMGCCPALTDGCRAEASLFKGSSPAPGAMLGMTRSPTCGGGCTPTVEVFMKGQGQPFSVVEGPTCCFAGLTEMCCEQDFAVSKTEGKAGDMALIRKEKPKDLKHAITEIATDSDTFTLTFKNQALNRDQKLVLLSSLLLLDYMFFEENQPFECGLDSCSVTCCYMYCGGCFCPCKCHCEGEGDY